METKVKVKSLISSRVLLSVPDLRLRRVWEKKGAVKGHGNKNSFRLRRGRYS